MNRSTKKFLDLVDNGTVYLDRTPNVMQIFGDSQGGGFIATFNENTHKLSVSFFMDVSPEHVGAVKSFIEYLEESYKSVNISPDELEALNERLEAFN